VYQSSYFLEYSILGQGGSTSDGEEDACGFSLVADSNEVPLIGSELVFEGPSAEKCLGVRSGLIPCARLRLEDGDGSMADRDLVRGSMDESGTPNDKWRGEKSTSVGIKKL
jgi:hypothetical protein